MNTKIYNVWAPLVLELITKITTSTEQYDALDKWLDNEGTTAFRVSQQNFFKDHKEQFQNTTSKVSDELFKLTQNQVLVGFNHWFDALITSFPALNTETVRDHFATLKVKCVDERYDAIFSIRTVLTCKHAQGKFNDPQLYLQEWEQLIEAATDSITAFNEQRNKAPQNHSLMHKSAEVPVQHEVIAKNNTP